MSADHTQYTEIRIQKKITKNSTHGAFGDTNIEP